MENKEGAKSVQKRKSKKETRSFFKSGICKVFLCIKDKRNCFKEFYE